ncbi:carbonic anhydrase [Pelagibacterium flavum]|uniref:Carbonic anhydrase n=1 Tax=Pelagibacterium flavum TaxID=2984530 RepID=A0ABY6IPB8_9HYPH|nr:carbonic anhydrase [Pelagibacterium sp. YIM 151497]MAN77962.1 carbonate dehydratase [Hyphomicrobiales bacterium]UYQ72428.1 carbonic anhydrase [Pelagibacterium sp. YIM 151497]|tara:strand:+ start:2168 stop:2812 length:645 start_codon:yes stop_codon:yes gene_type:complete
MAQHFPPFLIEGYRNFMSGRYATESERYRKLAEEGQKPTTMVIACCDSRAAPETIFDCGPGQLFVLRNVANLVPPFGPDAAYHGTSSAIEFAIIHLKVENIVVMGHGRCGGIAGALATAAGRAPEGAFIGKWLTMIEEVAGKVEANSLLTSSEQQTALERIVIRQSIGNLMTFPFVKERVQAGELSLHGAWFDISSGELWTMNGESGDFMRPEL